MKKICIELADDGTISVGEEPQNEGGMPEGSVQDAESDKSYMQPAESIDAALATAKQMLSGDQGQGLGPDNPFEQPKPEASMQQGFAKARGIPAGM